ncbi:fungal hydrophobin [Hysterangium stoloniferum]|nr:fungal hydrophobin [Hysterangium stoloniferum]
MLAKSIAALGFFSILAVAAPNPWNEPNQCGTSPALCCTAVGAASDSAVISALGLLAGLLNGITGIVGVGCVPIIGTVNCAQQPVCCTGNEFNGLINIGCSPISL